MFGDASPPTRRRMVRGLTTLLTGAVLAMIAVASGSLLLTHGCTVFRRGRGHGHVPSRLPRLGRRAVILLDATGGLRRAGGRA